MKKIIICLLVLAQFSQIFGLYNFDVELVNSYYGRLTAPVDIELKVYRSHHLI